MSNFFVRNLKATSILFLALASFCLAIFTPACDHENDPQIPHNNDVPYIGGTYTFNFADTLTSMHASCQLNVRSGKMVVHQRNDEIWGTMEDEILNGLEIPQDQRQPKVFSGSYLNSYVYISSLNLTMHAACSGDSSPFSMSGDYEGTDNLFCSWIGRWTAIIRN